MRRAPCGVGAGGTAAAATADADAEPAYAAGTQTPASARQHAHARTARFRGQACSYPKSGAAANPAVPAKVTSCSFAKAPIG